MTSSSPPDTPPLQLQLMADQDAAYSLRPGLKTLLQTGGVAPAMAEGIAAIRKDAGYTGLGPIDDVSLRQTKARALRDVDPEQMLDRLEHTAMMVAATPDVQATHNRLAYERIAARSCQFLNLQNTQRVPMKDRARSEPG